MCANFSGEGIITHVQLLIINYCFVVMPSLAGSYEVSPYLYGGLYATEVSWIQGCRIEDNCLLSSYMWCPIHQTEYQTTVRQVPVSPIPQHSTSNSTLVGNELDLLGDVLCIILCNYSNPFQEQIDGHERQKEATQTPQLSQVHNQPVDKTCVSTSLFLAIQEALPQLLRMSIVLCPFPMHGQQMIVRALTIFHIHDETSFNPLPHLLRIILNLINCIIDMCPEWESFRFESP